ncbi:MAG: oligosaccharide flippase family protein [Candidatus Schekmanbacteria bacterium]|nr:oligosaccharide flippase family protein [Candidatus Schekmanbacteria bacterium]
MTQESELTNPAQNQQSRKIKKNILAKGGWVLSARISIAVSNLLVNALLTRLLTPDEVGAYFLTFSLVSVATLIAQLGLCPTVVKIVAEALALNNSARARAAVKAVFLYGTIGALAVAGILSLGLGQWLAYRVFNSSIMAGIIQLAVFWIILLAYQNLTAESFRSFHDIRNASIYGGMATSIITTGLFAILCVLKIKMDLAKVLTLTISALSISLIIAGMLIYRKIRQFAPGGQIPADDIFAVAGPMLVNSVTAFALTQADIWVLGAFRPQSEVAVYGAAFRLVTMINLPLIIINGVVPPLIAQMYAQGRKKELESTLRAASSLALIASLTAFSIYLLGGRPFLELVYGKYYRDGAIILWILSLGQIVSVACGSCGFTLTMTGHQNKIVRLTLTSFVILVISALILVKPFGAVGVAIASAATIALQNLMALAFAKKYTGMWTHARFSLVPVKQFLQKVRG